MNPSDLDRIKDLEADVMGLKERVLALEGKRPKIIAHDRIYDALHQIAECTSPLAPDETQAQWEADFVEANGTREQFIENGRMMEEQRHE